MGKALPAKLFQDFHGVMGHRGIVEKDHFLCEQARMRSFKCHCVVQQQYTLALIFSLPASNSSCIAIGTIRIFSMLSLF
jgi:hypothetical protein